MKNIHATCISYKRKGILILGQSGSGKSDLALRMIMQKGAKLVSDDRTDIDDNLTASSPKTIQGLIEVRGLGIKKLPFVKKQKVHLAVELVKSLNEIERMPKDEYFEFEGKKIKKIKLYPFELSAESKLELALA